MSFKRRMSKIKQKEFNKLIMGMVDDKLKSMGYDEKKETYEKLLKELSKGEK